MKKKEMFLVEILNEGHNDPLSKNLLTVKQLQVEVQLRVTTL